MNVQFRRQRTGELQMAAVYIDQRLVPFRNEVAQQDLEPDRDYILSWRLIGDTGSSVKVVMTAEDVAQTLFEATLKHADGGRQANGKIFRLKGAVQ
ncbi:hypothetical protein [Brevundimonas sp.]|uniref:hypothetical protein n=1 Tax=Brevundimonas sp. TaxID=1871086 RepID=UPI002D41C9DC|nr:hypothetical protein [Brevundimonas sp.]HYD27329.1 hypothetical protein [Brevundimonas sp.]